MACLARRPLLAALAALAVPARAQTGAREVRDAAGRVAILPARITRVFPAGPPASILIWSLAPDLLAGWPGRGLRPAELAFMAPEAAALPTLGRLTGRDNTANMEAVLAQRPDLVLDYGSIAPTYVSLADRVRAQTGLPVLLLDGTLRNIPQTYRLLGEILDRRQVAEDLATRAEAILAAAEDSAAALRAKGRPRVLYVRGPRGTEAGLAGSITAEIMEFVGAENVARGDGGSMAQISAEQALAWDPDWLIGIDPAFAAFALQDPVWRLLRAVREGRFVIVPTLPYGWVDFPPSVNRLLGLVWLPSLFRQEKAEALVGPLTELYARLFHRRPEPAQIAALLRAAFPTQQG